MKVKGFCEEPYAGKLHVRICEGRVSKGICLLDCEDYMEKATRKELFRVAKDMARAPFHGTFDGLPSNLAPIVRLFPTWSVKEADGLWCAAFVYYCCTEAGFEIPYRPNECKTCHLAACFGWEEFAINDQRI